MNAAVRPIDSKVGIKADRPGAESHSAERHEEGVFAAYPVTHPSKTGKPPKGRIRNPASEQRDRAEQGRDRVGFFKDLTDRTAARLPKM